MTTPGFPKHLDHTEWLQLSGSSYPHLKEADVIATDNRTIQYNCIAFSLGRTDRWIKPDLSLDNTSLKKTLDLYKDYGYVQGPAANGLIDIWTRVDNGITVVQHASRRNGTTDVWESKIGASFRIRHSRNALADSDYGTVSVSLVQQGPALKFFTAADAKDAMVTRYINTLSEAHHNLKEHFDTKYAAWKKVWYKGFLSLRPDMFERTGGPCESPYLELLAIKTHQMLPFVVENLGGEDDTFSIQLYEDKQNDPRRKVASTEYVNYLDILNRRVAAFELYAKFVHQFDDCVTAWRENKKTSIAFALRLFNGPEGWDNQIIPLIMAEYYKHQLDEPWNGALLMVLDDEEPGMDKWKYADWKLWYEKP